jgi:hypothetical protein
MVRTGSSFSSRRDSPAAARKRAALGSGVEEGEGSDDVAEKIAGLLLLRLVQTETRGRLWNAGNGRASWSSVGSGELETGKERGGEIVWEVERSGVSLRVLAGVLL